MPIAKEDDLRTMDNKNQSKDHLTETLKWGKLR